MQFGSGFMSKNQNVRSVTCYGSLASGNLLQFGQGLIGKNSVFPFFVFQCHHNNRVWAMSSSANNMQVGIQEIAWSLAGVIEATQKQMSIRVVFSVSS